MPPKTEKTPTPQPPVEPILCAVDFYRHTNNQALAALQFPPYELKDSLHFWLHDFPDEVDSIGIQHINDCCLHIRRFMPSSIRQFITSLPPNIKTD
jgi:hypothetical protein